MANSYPKVNYTMQVVAAKQKFFDNKMQHLLSSLYSESDKSAADHIKWVGPILNILPGDNNKTCIAPS